MGDGKGGTETKIGKFDTFAECVAAVKDQKPTANGVTWGKGKSRKGQCYAEFGQTKTKSSKVWQNCVIEPTPAADANTDNTSEGSSDDSSEGASEGPSDESSDGSSDLDAGKKWNYNIFDK